MTTRATKKTASRSNSTHAQEQETSNLEPANPEAVMRYELLGCCDFLLVDPGERMPAAVRQSLFELQKGARLLCIMQCAGYVFNVTALPSVTFMNRDGKVTGSSIPKSEGGRETK